MFLIALGWITGAAIVDMTLIFFRAVKRWRETAAVPKALGEDVGVQGWRRVHTVRLVIWSICWGAAVVAVGHLVLQQPVLYLVVALAVNAASGGNYGFLSARPSIRSMLDFFSDTPWLYVLQIDLPGLLFFLLLDLPWPIARWRASLQRGGTPAACVKACASPPSTQNSSLSA